MGTRTNVFGVQIRTFLELPFSLREMAGATGLEPATFGVTGRHSNQLSYAPAAVPLKGRAKGVDVRAYPCPVKQLAYCGGGPPPPPPRRRRPLPCGGAAGAGAASGSLS